MRSHRRRHPLRHALVAGDIADIESIQRELAALPADAYGQVLVEVPLGMELPDLVRPARVSVHRLDHIETIDALSGSVAAGGSVLTAAVDAWIAEWMPTGSGDDREVTLWISGAERAAEPLTVLGDLVEGA